MIGRTISHYTIIEQLGRGGMGVVYKAMDNRLGRPVALKFLSPELCLDPEAKQRFFHEARAASTLEHQNICAIHDIDETADGQIFICMSYYEGRTLRDRLQTGPLLMADAIWIARQLADGLGRAHGCGIVHRDIKPANLIITPAGEVKVVDFGLARLADQTRITKSGATLGTAAYMAPEQALGEPADERTDIWAAGVVIYEMLAGRLPFRGEYDLAIAYAIINETPPPLAGINPAVPPELERIVGRCLAKKPADRYARAADLGADLARVEAKYCPESATRPGAHREVWPPWLRGRRLAALGAVVAILVVGGPFVLLPAWRTAAVRWLGLASLPSERRVVVLSFDTGSDDTASRAMADGFRAVLLEQLLQVETAGGPFWALSLDDLASEKIDSPAKARQIFNANLVLAGRFTRRGTQAVLALEVRDAATGAVIRSREIADHESSIATFQDGLLAAAEDLLDLGVPDAIRRRIGGDRTALPGAYRYYLQGMGYLSHPQRSASLNTALELFGQAARNDPDYNLAPAGQAEAHLRRFWNDNRPEDLATAEVFARHSLKLGDRPATRLVLAYILRGQKRFDEAVRELGAALRLQPTLFDAVLLMGRTEQALDRLQAAEGHYRRLIELRPRSWQGYSNLGFLYYRIGRYAEAAQLFEKGIEQAPENMMLYSNLFAMYYKLEDHPRAESTIERALRQNQELPAAALSNWGTFYFYQRRYVDAAGLFERAAALDSEANDYVIWGNLAESYRQLPGREADARAALAKAIGLAEYRKREQSADPALSSRLAFYYALDGRSAAALAEIDEARRQAPRDAEVLLRAVRVYELSGRRDDALAALGEAVTRNASLSDLTKDPDLADLRRDPRFGKTVKNVPTNGQNP
jgi:tetratricopeptide (TPR) repeat protein